MKIAQFSSLFFSFLFIGAAHASINELVMPNLGHEWKGRASDNSGIGMACSLRVITIRPNSLVIEVKNNKLEKNSLIIEVSKIELNGHQIYTDLATVQRVMKDQVITKDAIITIRLAGSIDGLALAINRERKNFLLCVIPYDLQ